MNDFDLIDTWTTLDPAFGQRRRIEARVASWLDAHDTSILAEWLGLFRLAPVTAVSLAAVSAVAMIATTPLVWVVASIVGALR